MFDEWQQGHVFVGQAMGHIRTASNPQASPQADPARQLQHAGRAVGRAYQLFVRAGMTPKQAVARIISLAETFGSLE